MDDSRTQLQELMDRQRIWECLLRYTRGVDRLDRELLLSAYHPDAIDDHGAFAGPVDQFADWVLGFHGEHQSMTQHSLHNHSCEIDGNQAHAETYVTYYGVNLDGTDTIGIGRYVDRLEKRDGYWAIAARLCLTQAMHVLLPGENDAAAKAAMLASGATRDRADPSYHRPLRLEATKT